MDRFNEQIKFLARKNLAQSKRMTILNSRVKSKRELENEQSIRTILPQHNKQNVPIPSIKVQHPEGHQHFSGALHLYLRSSLAKHSQKRHIKQPSHYKQANTQRKHNYEAPIVKQQFSRLRSKSTMKNKIEKDLKSQLSQSIFARQQSQRPQSRRKYLQVFDLNMTDRSRQSGVKRVKGPDTSVSVLENETKKMIKRRDDYVRSSFKLG